MGVVSGCGIILADSAEKNLNLNCQGGKGMELTSDEVLSLANTVLKEAGINRTLHSIHQCNSSVFVSLYKALTQEDLPIRAKGVWSTSATNEAIRCQYVIDVLSQLLPPEVSLSHIIGRDIAEHDLLSVKNLLDIFSILLNLPCANNDGYEEDSSDSNLITGEGLQVVNQVLQEEELYSSLDTASLIADTSPYPHQGTPLHHPFIIPSSSAPCTVDSRSLHDTPATPIPTLTPVKPNLPMLAPPLHSTPHQGCKSRVENVVSLRPLHTPPLSISTVSSDSDVPPRESHTHSSQLNNSQNSPVSRGHHAPSPPANKEGVSVHDSEDTTTDERPDNRNSFLLSKREILERMTSDYVRRKQPQRMKGNTLKGKHSPVCHRRSKEKPDKNRPHSLVNDTCSAKAVTNGLFATVEEAFPGIHISPVTMRRLRTQEVNRMKAQVSCPTTANTARKKAEEIQKRNDALVSVMRKDLEHSRRMQLILEQRIQKGALQTVLRNQRMASAKAKQYFRDYELTIRAKLQKRRTKEEMIFRTAYKECLKLQKEKALEMKRFAKEKRMMEARKYEMKLESMEKFYQDKLKILAESIQEDQQNTRLREKALKQVADRTERELRQNMESEISSLWAGLERWEEDCAHFRELDKETLKKELYSLV